MQPARATSAAVALRACARACGVAQPVQRCHRLLEPPLGHLCDFGMHECTYNPVHCRGDSICSCSHTHTHTHAHTSSRGPSHDLSLPAPASAPLRVPPVLDATSHTAVRSLAGGSAARPSLSALVCNRRRRAAMAHGAKPHLAWPRRGCRAKGVTSQRGDSGKSQGAQSSANAGSAGTPTCAPGCMYSEYHNDSGTVRHAGHADLRARTKR
jgi:hypothetical protein